MHTSYWSRKGKAGMVLGLHGRNAEYSDVRREVKVDYKDMCS
jgi:hypothetical protein